MAILKLKCCFVIRKKKAVGSESNKKTDTHSTWHYCI